MRGHVHHVGSGPRHPVKPLPRDTWRGGTFTEADGTQLEVIWNGHRKGPLLCAPIDRSRDNADHRIALLARRY